MPTSDFDVKKVKKQLDALQRRALETGKTTDLNAYQFGCAWYWPQISQWIHDRGLD